MKKWNEIEQQATTQYLKLKAGNTKIRILTDAIQGYEAWTEENGKKKPVRKNSKFTQDELNKLGATDKPKGFIACLVYDYSDSIFKVWQITQLTIQNALVDLAQDEAWGDPTEYDIRIKKTGEGKETNYFLTPAGQKEKLSDDILLNMPEVNLNNLFLNKDPFEVQSNV